MKNTSKKLSFKLRLTSFQYAFKGLASAFRQEHNMRIHIFAAIIAILLGFIFKISTLEWVGIAVAITMVLVSELLNSAIEGLVDLNSQGFNKKAGRIKDIAAGAVLVAALGALSVGLLVFLPRLF
ncbi:MAG: diacylglycerol kinase family protein [Bacteroidales bacterium]|nr:diacylglycerol kinase family protein [Bacteroidales bacterium]